MKKLVLILITMLLTAAIFAQTVPQTANFSATVRDGDNKLLKNTSLTVRISFINGVGTTVYWEEHIASTNENGFVSFLLNRGTNETFSHGGTVDSFSEIPWESGGYTMNVQYKRTGENEYIDLGNFELTSGFYAFAAQKLEGFDIDVSGASSDDVLVYDGTKWVASAESQTLADVATLGNSMGNKQIKNVTDPTEDQDATTKKYVDDLIATLEAAVEALQDRRPVVVTFDANGGSGSMQSQVFLTGAAQTISANTFTKTDYVFAGWNTAADGSGTSYTDGQSIAISENITLYAQWEVPTTGTLDGHGWVDLGLPSGTRWATCNIGATNPEDYGDYFAWGETTTKSTYDWSTYSYCNGSSSTLTKYCNNSRFGNNGFTDALTTLEATDDAATANWGAGWRMPTKQEMQELVDNCDTTWTTQNGVAGMLFTSRTNGNSIFLPAAGHRYGSELINAGSYGHYWSSSLLTGGPYDARYLDFDSGNYYMGIYYRNYGFTVRPVCVSAQH